MNPGKPQAVKARHLSRKAFVYVRQSTEVQVVENEGSCLYQRGQTRYAESYGWEPDMIETVDDLGSSGTGTKNRPGYLRMVAEIIAGRVGAILVSDFTRGGRDAMEWFRLIDLCMQHDALIIVNGKVYDLEDGNELLLARIIASLGDHENGVRRGHAIRGRTAKVLKGKAVSPPPTGYVRATKGSWIKDPDPAVQAAISAVPRLYLECRTLAGTVRAMRALGMMMPHRKKAIVTWDPPTVTRLSKLLRNPAFWGEYCFGQRRVIPGTHPGLGGHRPTRQAAEDEIMRVPGHHEPYIGPEEAAEIRSILNSHAPSPLRRSPGRGSALLQRLVRCAKHPTRAMASIYRIPGRAGNDVYDYYCAGDQAYGGPQCGHIPGPVLDQAVAQELLNVLKPPTIDAIREEWRKAKQGEAAEAHRVQQELGRRHALVADLEYRFFAVDPRNRLVAQDLESKLEAAKRGVEVLQREPGRRIEGSFFNDAAFDELVELCEELPSLWNATTTEHQDRKEIAGSMIDHVVFETKDLKALRARIVWADGRPDTPLYVLLNRHGRQKIVELAAQGLSPIAIALRLNELNIPTTKGRPWRRESVFQYLWRLRKRAESKQKPTPCS